MKGIILAAGKGTRLYPITCSVCKPLLPVYDKPMIYYPLSLFLEMGIKEVLIIVSLEDREQFIRLLDDGSRFGINIYYMVQHDRRGIADAFILGEDFIGGDSVCLALGDNIFFGRGLREKLLYARSVGKTAMVFGCYMDDPRPFGVVEFDSGGHVISIEEKPEHPRSNYIIPGLYFYDSRVSEIAKRIKPSARGELEITSVNNVYLERGELDVVLFDKDLTWFDTGSSDSLLAAACAIRDYKNRTGETLACLEAIAYRSGLIDKAQLKASGERLKASDYGQYLLEMADSVG